MPTENVLVVGNISFPPLGSTHLESNRVYCYMVSDVNRRRLEVRECTASNSTACQSLNIHQNSFNQLKLFVSSHILKFTSSYGKPIVCQLEADPIQVVHCDNTYLNRPDSKFEANNHDRCCTFSAPKIIQPMVLWDICVELGQEWLKKHWK